MSSKKAENKREPKVGELAGTTPDGEVAVKNASADGSADMSPNSSTKASEDASANVSANLSSPAYSAKKAAGGLDPTPLVFPNAKDASAFETQDSAGMAEVAAQSIKILQLEAELSRLREDFLRAKAEADNTRRRAQNDVQDARKYAVRDIATALLPVKDSLEAALQDQSNSLEALREGVQLTLRQLNSALETAVVQELNPVGEKFDPNRHQSIAMIEGEGEANRVISVLQKGYQIYDRVLRPAMVTVSAPAKKPPPPTPSEKASTSDTDKSGNPE